MADKNITLRQKNTSGVYDKLYAKTTATQSKLSTETATLFGNNIADADAALAKIADTVKGIGNVRVKVVDPNGNPIQGAKITGLYGTPTTASDGTAHGVLQTNPISISSPYIDLKDQTVDASRYAGSFNVLIVALPIVGENNIKRITSSQAVKFKLAKTVDVCCVGGGGGGYRGYTRELYGFYEGAGGGGGGIVNTFGVPIIFDNSYQMQIGAGGAVGGTGGTTTFLNVSAPGGTGASLSSLNVATPGKAGVDGCGDGGYLPNSYTGEGGSNTTISEFNDGTTYYSGGGASGRGNAATPYNGGNPNGAKGAAVTHLQPGIAASNASTGGGGGGGAGYKAESGSFEAAPSRGGSGLVAIRFHF